MESVIVNALQKRLNRLERETAGSGNVVVIEGPDGRDLAEVRANLGSQIKSEDPLIYLRDFCSDDPPWILSIQPSSVR